MAQQNLIDASLQYTGQGSGATVVSNRARIQANFTELYGLAKVALVRQLVVTAGASASVRIACPAGFKPELGAITATSAATTAGTLTGDVTDGTASLLDSTANLKLIDPGTVNAVELDFDEDAEVAAGGVLVVTVASSNGDLTGLANATVTIIGSIVP
jgi:hypothetical protein